MWLSFLCLLFIFDREDKEGYFQSPVTREEAPNYYKVITQPMDFSTMKRKIHKQQYKLFDVFEVSPENVYCHF